MAQRRYDKEFKKQAVALSDEVGIRQAARQLGIPHETIYSWRSQMQKRGQQSFIGSGHSYRDTAGKTPRELELEREVAELQRANDILKDALGFFAKDRKK